MPPPIDKIPQLAREYFTAHEYLRRMGVPADDIFCAIERPVSHVAVKKNGQWVFKYPLQAPVGGELGPLRQSIVRLAPEWNSPEGWSPEEKIALIEGSNLRKEMVKFATAAVIAGLKQ